MVCFQKNYPPRKLRWLAGKFQPWMKMYLQLKAGCFFPLSNVSFSRYIIYLSNGPPVKGTFFVVLKKTKTSQPPPQQQQPPQTTVIHRPPGWKSDQTQGTTVDRAPGAVWAVWILVGEGWTGHEEVFGGFCFDEPPKVKSAVLLFFFVFCWGGGVVFVGEKNEYGWGKKSDDFFLAKCKSEDVCHRWINRNSWCHITEIYDWINGPTGESELNMTIYGPVSLETICWMCVSKFGGVPPKNQSAKSEFSSTNLRTSDMCWSLNSHCFHIIGDSHQPNGRVYKPIIRIPY